ncbi:MAG: TonB-dependent receptor [Saprospiraceae bacterium]|nr:MAG: TonB-dependent receptor plug [Bacteroidetes bacterium OLB9]MCO6464847.1 TonB-dependent receptor [Saprospiraceae bacterium]MCZ2339931.1 TonB-dependent receptor [Chitinophagales bacterium]
MRYILSLAFILVLSTAHAQFPFSGGAKGPTIKGKIEGTVVDSLTKEKVSFATVTLKKKGSSIIQNGVLSDENGFFRIEEIVNGQYDIYVSFIGYEDKKVTVETTLKSPDLNIEHIYLTPSATVLDAVNINEERTLFENRADKLVFNAENDASIAGGDATDVLRKVPMLSVDLNGNVSLRGSQNVKILINGKPSGMFSSNVAEALKMFPADQIKKVEVITSPSAKYDAEGSAGLINIITKKQNVDGFAGSINASIGNRQNSTFINLNAGKGRFGLSSGGALFYSPPAKGTNEFYRFDKINSGTISQNGDHKSSTIGGNGSLSAFYDFNGFNSINSSFNFRGFGLNVDGTTIGAINQSGLVDNYTRTNTSKNLNSGFDWSTDFTHKFEKRENQEISFGVQYSRQNTDQDNIIDEMHDFDLLNRNTDINNDGVNHETTLQVDYTHPFTKAIKLETGLKTIIRNIISNYNTQVFDITNGYTPLVETFNYHQNVYAGYASMSFIIARKYNLITGARYEQTGISGAFDKSTDLDFENIKYNNLLPNLTISRTFSGFRTLKLSYTQRIQRPSLSYINPFNNNADFVNQTIGNPMLNPELVHQVELGYNFTFKGFTTFSSLFYKHTDDIIEQILSLNENNLSVNTFENVGTKNSLGLNTFISKSVSLFTFRTGGNIATYDAKGIVNGNPEERKSFEYNIFLNGEAKITGTFKADFFGFFRSPVRTIQGDNPAFTIYGMGLRKEFKNFSLGVTLIEPFNANKYFKTNIETEEIKQSSSIAVPFRSFGLNVRYKFGNVDFKERQSKVKNTDLKDASGNNQGGMNMGSGGNNTLQK